jgi:hypothetical protein
VLFGTSPTPASTKLVLHPFFPILVAGLVDYLSAESERAPALLPGESFSTTVPPVLIGKKVFLSSDRSEGLTDIGVVAAAETEGRIQIPSLDNPGGYQVFVEGREEAVAAFSVALDPSESVLTTVEPVQLSADKEKATPSGPTTAKNTKIPREVWMVFAVILLLLFLTELALAHRFTMTR